MKNLLEITLVLVAVATVGFARYIEYEEEFPTRIGVHKLQDTNTDYDEEKRLVIPNQRKFPQKQKTKSNSQHIQGQVNRPSLVLVPRPNPYKQIPRAEPKIPLVGDHPTRIGVHKLQDTNDNQVTDHDEEKRLVIPTRRKFPRKQKTKSNSQHIQGQVNRLPWVVPKPNPYKQIPRDEETLLNYLENDPIRIGVHKLYDTIMANENQALQEQPGLHADDKKRLVIPSRRRYLLTDEETMEETKPESHSIQTLEDRLAWVIPKPNPYKQISRSVEGDEEDYTYDFQ